MDVMRGHQRRLTHRQQELCQAFRKAVEKGASNAVAVNERGVNAVSA